MRFLRFNIRNKYKVATLNVRGARFAHKQMEVQEWMATNHIPIALLQETKNPGMHKLEK